MAALQNISEFYGAWFAIRPANQNWGTFSPQESTISQQALKMWVKVPEMKCSLWCERDITELNAKSTKKHSGVNAPNGPLGGDSGDKVGGGSKQRSPIEAY